MMMRLAVVVGLVIAALLFSFIMLSAMNTGQEVDARVVRIGLQANLTHAPALVAKSNDAFGRGLGMKVEYRVFKAGPDTMFALMMGQVDIAYTGPIPAVQANLASSGSVRIIAGSTSGGAMFITREGIDALEDLRGRKFGTPQYGNTQDIALRSYLLEHGLRLKEDMGDITIINARSPELLFLFRKGEIDGLWVPEPWASMALKDGGKVFLDERSLWPDGRFATTVVVARSDLIDEHPDLIDRVLRVHIDTVMWMNEHRDEALSIVAREVRGITGQSLPEDVAKGAFSSLEFTYDPMQESIQSYIRKGTALGIFNSEPERLFYHDGLRRVMQQDGNH